MRKADKELKRKGKLADRISKLENKTWSLISKGDYNGALQIISALASFYYGSNQKYTDKNLEDMILAMELPMKCVKMKTLFNTVLFYDGFGFDIRGLAFIYIKALCEKGYHVVYIVDERKSHKLPNINGVLKKYGGEMVCIPYGLDYMECAVFINHTVVKKNVAHAMLYTTPYDSSAVLAFTKIPNNIRRYQINLTDHAFWLGVHAFDYCIEFRNHGASISEYYRGIDKSKLLMLPYYPGNGYKGGFQGFPFERQKDDFVVFSGGSMYKTKDREGTYYKIVRYLLKHYPNVKFWYAGTGENKGMKTLLHDFRGRVFFTSERKDISFIMQHCDIYLSTYPIAGGLMSQYAAAAGCIPLTLRRKGTVNGGTLTENNECKFLMDSPEELLKEFDKLYHDDAYREKAGEAVCRCVPAEDIFACNLNKILKEGKSDFQMSTKKIDTSDFLKLYDTGDFTKLLSKVIGSPKYPSLFRIMPYYYTVSLLKKIMWWIGCQLEKKFR